ncbi:MAG: haloacid dehalogenase-like hydrolase [Oscillospiraceae bacterium]|nr:haloacid dehalogenase-like hydrolase [Oscillospiraceae bacterium]
MRVFDFDNTIYDGESGMDLFLYFFKKDPKGLLKYAPNFLECFIKYKRGKITVDEVMNDYSLVLKEYCHKVDDIFGEFEKFWDLNQKKIKDFYYKIQDEEDIIVSACPECLLKIICDRVGIKHYIGSDVDPINGTITSICYKDNKVKAFSQVYGDVQIDEFYTDSMSDKPLMDISQNVFLVDGDKIIQIKKNGIEIA